MALTDWLSIAFLVVAAFALGAAYGIRTTNEHWRRRMTALHRLGAVGDRPVDVNEPGGTS